MNRVLYLTTMLFCLLLTPVMASEKIQLATLDWEPYIGQSLKDNGYVAVVVKEAFKRSGYEVELQYHQWTRTVGLAQNGEVAGYLPEYYAEEVKQYASFSEPFPGGPLGFFKAAGKDISYSTLEDLKGLKIGVVKGYANTQEFDAATFLTKDEGKDDLTNFKKLAAGRIDLVVADKFVGLQIIKEQLPDQVGKIEFVEKSLEDKDLYVCISKKAPNHDALLAAFNEGLAQMKADGSIDRILKDYGF